MVRKNEIRQERIIYTLSQAQQSGHLYMNSDELCHVVTSFLSKESTSSISKSKKVLLDMVLGGHLQEDSGRIYFPNNYVAEQETAKIAKSMIKTTHTNINLDNVISRVEVSLKIKLAVRQKEAVKMVINNNFSIITGGPGTSKTTVINIIHSIYQMVYKGKVAFTAPTGRASGRLSEGVGEQARCCENS
ncbi:MAG: AAA family ATPase [Defluviitaleaceae bacterium]|nr:AAA family ATPase [Defluviitaleaceae bacterium]